MTRPSAPAPDQRELSPSSFSFEDLDDSTIDEFSPYGRDPFDVVAALEEELGQSLWSS